MKPKLHTLSGLLVFILFSTFGCVPLPIPNNQLFREGLTIEIIDEDTKVPISDAVLKVRFGYDSPDEITVEKEKMDKEPFLVTVISDSKGQIEIKKDNHFTPILLVGPVDGSDYDWPPPSKKNKEKYGARIDYYPYPLKVVSIEVRIEGYETFNWNAIDISNRVIPEVIKLKK